MKDLGTFLLDEHHFAPSINVGTKASKDVIHKYYEIYMQKLTQVEDKNVNPSDMFSLIKSISILFKKYGRNSQKKN